MAQDVIEGCQMHIRQKHEIRQTSGRVHSYLSDEGRIGAAILLLEGGVGVLLHDHPESPFTPQGYLELEATVLL